MDRRQLIVAALAALAPATARASGGESKEDRKKGGGSTFVQLPTLTATVTRMGGRRGVMTVDVGLDIPDEALRDRVALSAPRLRAGYTQALAMYAAGLPAARAPNADFIAGQLQAQTDNMLGRKGARLLVGTILIN